MATMPFDMKKTSYPSRQIRGGPAPLASFEDLSDAISESPEDDKVPSRDDDDADDPDDYDSRTYSDGATPSTPRVLAQTPSTPLALDSFSIGTPDSFGHQSTSFGLNSRPETPPNDNSLGRSSSSPRMSPLLGGGRSSKVTTPDPSLNLSSGVAVDAKQPKKSTAGTPSPRSARKLFTMSFFKPREDKSPSPMISPKSPRRLSPSALSPKSPRKTPFGGLFRSKDMAQQEVGTGNEHLGVAVGGYGSGLPSPTKKKGHFAHFLRPKEDKKHDGTVSLDHGGRKEGGGRYAGVFANLFRRSDVVSSRSTISSPSDNKNMSPVAHAPEDEEWAVSKVQATSVVESETVDGVRDQFVTNPLPSVVDRIGVSVDDRRLFESSHDIADAIVDKYDPKLRLGLSPSNDNNNHSTVSPIVTSSLTDLVRENKSDLSRVEMMGMIIESSSSSNCVPPLTDNLSLDCNRQESVLKSSSQIANVVTCVPTDDKMSPGSEVDTLEADPALLKTLKGDEPEAETLLREDSFETDDFVVDVTTTVADETGASRTTPDKELIPRHRDKIASFRMNPVDRPRSTAPVSFSSLEAYISIVTHQQSTGQLTTPTTTTTTTTTMTTSTVSCSEGGGGGGIQTESAKLKVILPGEEFEHKPRQGKKPVYKSWIEFCEVGLQSPRSRRRQMVGERASSAPSDSSTRSFHKESARSSSVVERRKLTDTELFSASSDTWVTFETSSPIGEVRNAKKRQFSSRSLPHPRKSSSSSSRSSSPPHPHPHQLRSLDVHSLDVVLQNGRDIMSSGSSSQSNSPHLLETVNLKTVEDDDEEVEPLVSGGGVDSAVDRFNTVSGVIQPQFFFGDSQFVQVQSSLDDWTLTTTTTTTTADNNIEDDVNFEHRSVIVPDCVASAHLQNKSSVVGGGSDGGGGCESDSEEVSDWFNGGIDLLASIPCSLSKQSSESPPVVDSSSSSVPFIPPRNPQPVLNPSSNLSPSPLLPPPPPLPRRQAPSRRGLPPPPPTPSTTAVATTVTSIRGQHM